MKLVVQIPCANEEQGLPLVLQKIPKHIPGVDEIVILVIDDGCTDKTVEIARAHGITEFVFHTQRRGLGTSFRHGAERALELGADILVNTDGDNQYPQEKIPELIKPILDHKADVVVADRQTNKIAHFSPLKKVLQRIGSKVVNIAAGTDLPDAPSGFRAYSRQALLEINPITMFSYTMETIIQAGNKHLAITSIPIETNAKVRESRLFRSNWEHIRKSGTTILRAYVMYRPHVVFGGAGLVLLVAGLLPFARFVYLTVTNDSSDGHLQSLIIGLALITGSFICFALNIIADLVRTNRTLIEQDLELTKKLRYSK